MANLWKLAKWTGAALTGGYVAWQSVRYAKTCRNFRIAAGKRIVILGGGFSGRAAASELARLLPGRTNGEILLVDQRPYLLFTPMLTEVIAGDVRSAHILNSNASLPSRVRYVRAKIEKIDLAEKSLKLSNQKTLRADELVVALGSTSNFHHAEGIPALALPVKSIQDADAIYKTALKRLDEAESEQDAGKRREILTFLVAGGGYTGVEAMAALNEMIREEIRRRPALKASDLRMIIAEPMERIMNEVTPDLAAYSQKELEKEGVEVLLKVAIKAATPALVTLADGREIPCRTLIWTAGVMPSQLVQKADGPKGKQHGLKVEPSLAVEGKPGIWAVGDCAEIPNDRGENGEDTYAPTAQNATREGVHVARNIVRSLRGDPLRPFRYTPVGALALVAKRRGVARVYGHNFSGLAGWGLWHGVYLAKMPGVLQRIQIVADWLRSEFSTKERAV